MKRKQLEPEINVTPLVDVVLVLLIIFMVIAPQLENGLRLDLPTVERPDKSPKSKLDPITVSVVETGEVYVDKDRFVDTPALEAHLRALRDEDSERRVVLKADNALAYKPMRDTFALVQKVGFSGVALAVSKRGGGNDEEE